MNAKPSKKQKRGCLASAEYPRARSFQQHVLVQTLTKLYKKKLL